MTSQVITISSPEQVVQISDSGKYEVVLVHPHASVTIRGQFRLQEADHQSVTLVVRHQAPHTRAEIVLKGVCSDKANLYLEGTIIVEETAVGTISHLTERVLLLSDQAHAETVPNLEIKTDDVQCSHAASISRLNEEQLFYLQSRGLTQAEAEQLLVESFLA